ncbi:MAG: hypothetical protein WCY19_05135 [Candidatus Gastranaerophilaceae bacterium]
MSRYFNRDLGRTFAQRKWTITAIECYKRGCVCDGCVYQDFFDKSSSDQKCQVKASVVELVRTIGLPEDVGSKGAINA